MRKAGKPPHGRRRDGHLPHRAEGEGLQHHHLVRHDLPGGPGDAGLAFGAQGLFPRPGGRVQGAREDVPLRGGRGHARGGGAGVRGVRLQPEPGLMPPGRRPSLIPFVLDFLVRAYPSARVVLRYENPFELLMATVLAAQCTDDRVNQVTPALFARYSGPEAIAAASQEEIEEAVRPTGFYRNKAKALKGISAALVSRHGGLVPKSMEDLTALPGVGRKTAAILLGACFGAGALPVDTHVGRVSFRLGLTSSKDPARAE